MACPPQALPSLWTPQHLVFRCVDTTPEASLADQPQLVLTHTQFLRETLQDLLRDPTPNSKHPVTVPGLWLTRKEHDTRSGSQVPHRHPW